MTGRGQKASILKTATLDDGQDCVRVHLRCSPSPGTCVEAHVREGELGSRWDPEWSDMWPSKSQRIGNGGLPAHQPPPPRRTKSYCRHIGSPIQNWPMDPETWRGDVTAWLLRDCHFLTRRQCLVLFALRRHAGAETLGFAEHQSRQLDDAAFCLPFATAQPAASGL